MLYLIATIYVLLSTSSVEGQGTSSITTFTGQACTLNCAIQSGVTSVLWEGPPQLITYYIGGGGFNNVLLPQEKVRRLSIFTNYSLEINSTQSDDSGVYMCTQQNNEMQQYTLATTLDVRIKAASPVITSSVSADGSKVLATEGQSLIINCISSGGKPATSVILYKGSVNSPTLPGTTSVRKQGDGTYNVTLTSTFTPTRLDDGEQLVCRSYWPTPAYAQNSQLVNVTLYLYLTPSQPRVTQTLPVTTDSDVTVQCRTNGSRPAATISWMYQNQTLVPYNTSTQNSSTGTFSTVSFLRRHVTAIDNGQTVLCRAIHLTGTLTGEVTLDVLFPVSPLSTRISGNRVTVANGSNQLLLKCTTGSSNPAATIIWMNKRGVINNESPYTRWTGENNGTVTSQVLNMRPTRDENGDTITCSVSNSESSTPVTDSVTLELHYSPLIGMLTDQTVVEGDNVDLKCKAISKPTARFRWEKNSKIVAQGNGTASYNGLDYNIISISRTQTGTYTCIAENQIPPKDSMQAKLVVQYPPDVVVTAINTTVHNQSTTLICGATGVPDQYTYERWVHTFNGVQVKHPHPLPASRELMFTGLSYAHSGVYRCGASNDVKGVVTYDEDTLLVQSVPIIMGEIANSKEIKATGQLMNPTVITFQYYSNAGIGSVSVKRKNGTGEEVGEVHQRSVDVQLPVFLSEISTPGIEVTINITVTDESHFGEYKIIVTNEIDPVNLSLIIQPLGPPETPIFVNSTVLNHHSVIISWISGFPNGLNQTFVLQLSTDNSTWWNITQNGGMSFQQTHIQRVDNLASSQVYFCRMLAVNREGESQPTSILMFKTEELPDSNTSPSIGLIAGGAAGGAVAALLVIAIIVFIVWKRRYMSPLGKKTDTGILVMSRNHHQEYDEGDEEVENPAYVSAGPREIETVVGASSKKQEISSDGGNIYAKVNKKPEDLYAVPDKSKGKKADKMKQKPGKADKDAKTKKNRNIKTTHHTGDMYENASSTTFGTKSTPQLEETVYEDTNITTSATPQRPAGTDGLLYADLEFGPEKTGPTKIIGTDDRCEYTTIDLTKKAQPLPDSDDENKMKP